MKLISRSLQYFFAFVMAFVMVLQLIIGATLSEFHTYMSMYYIFRTSFRVMLNVLF